MHRRCWCAVWVVGSVAQAVHNHSENDGCGPISHDRLRPARLRVPPVVPAWADAAHPELEARYGAGFIDRLQKTLVDMEDAELLSAFPRRALIPARNQDFDAIERLARELGFIR